MSNDPKSQVPPFEETHDSQRNRWRTTLRQIRDQYRAEESQGDVTAQRKRFCSTLVYDAIDWTDTSKLDILRIEALIQRISSRETCPDYSLVKREVRELGLNDMPPHDHPLLEAILDIGNVLRNQDRASGETDD